jgi:hypothetical protein
MPLPESRTVDDLRSARSRYGFPGDRERFEEEPAAAIGAFPANDFEGATAVVRTYRHRVRIRNSPNSPHSPEIPGRRPPSVGVHVHHTSRGGSAEAITVVYTHAPGMGPIVKIREEGPAKRSDANAGQS